MSSVLITGAGGFTGQHLIDCLTDDYSSIIGLTSSKSTLQSTAHITYYAGDIGDAKLIKTVLAKHHPEAIVHLAAQTTAWFKDPAQIFKTNVLGTINLYEEIVKLRTESGYNPKILYVSSSEVYGKTVCPELINEDAPFFPVNHYASSKVSADRASYEYSQSNKLNIIIARAFTYTGPGQKLGFFVPDMASQVAALENDPNNKELLVGNLDAIRDYLDVRDVASAYKLIIEKDIPSGTALNVCSGRGIQVKKILEILLGMAQKSISLKTDSARMRPSDVPVFIGDNSRLHELTGWRPSIEITDTLRKTLDFWRSKNLKGEIL